jgi:hypothetical protein
MGSGTFVRISSRDIPHASCGAAAEPCKCEPSTWDFWTVDIAYDEILFSWDESRYISRHLGESKRTTLAKDWTEIDERREVLFRIKFNADSRIGKICGRQFCMTSKSVLHHVGKMLQLLL